MAYQLMSQQLNRAKEMLGGANAIRQEFEVGEVLAKAVGNLVGYDRVKIEIGTGAEKIFADPILLSGALAELTKNSLEATDDQENLEVLITVTRFEQSERPWIRITVEDNGPGVSEDDRQFIFDDFFTHRRHGDGGMGLGLTYVKRAAEAHGGNVECLERPAGTGACFQFEFPASRYALNCGETDECHPSN